MVQLNTTMFKAYDIRTEVSEHGLNENSVWHLGRAYATYLINIGETHCHLSRDGRLSGPVLRNALSQGLQAGGIHVIDLGMNPTPVLYFACATSAVGNGIQITGSHNPPQYNGLKIVCKNEAFFGERLQTLLQICQTENYVSGKGSEQSADYNEPYIQRICADSKIKRKMHIICDAGSGSAGVLAPKLFRALGCEVEAMYCEVDGNFPHHHPDPADPRNLIDLQNALKQGKAEIGFAFDGDGDRLGLVTKQGKIIWPDRQMMMFIPEILSRYPGAPIIFDVKCSVALAPWIEKHGGKPVMYKTGHSLQKAKLKALQGPFGGEFSGHLLFRDRWYGFDDALYVAARTLELLSQESDGDAFFAQIPEYVSTPELKLVTPEGRQFSLCVELAEAAKANLHEYFPSAQQLHLIDGVRVEYADGFGLVRPSNTTPVVTLRFEGLHEQALLRIQAEFRNALLKFEDHVSF